MDFEFLFKPVEDVDAWLTGLLAGAPLLVALLIAFAARAAPRVRPGPSRRRHVAGRERQR